MFTLMLPLFSTLLSLTPPAVTEAGQVSSTAATLYNTGYEVILASILGATLAQLLKFIGLLTLKRSYNFRILVQTGGMPSSHSSSMSALATSVGLIDGFASTTFAVAVGIALVVMYDAAGVRRAAGRMAGILNKLTEDLYTQHPEYVPERLRELLGHTPFEVLVGAILGVGFSVYFHYALRPVVG
jgi:uncharacterized protein